MYVYTQFEFACKLGKLDEVQRQSVISFPVMSKDMTLRVCEANSVSKNHEVIFTAIFEITKEGRKHTGISSAVC